MNKTEVLQQQINNLLLLKSIQKNNHLLTELDTLRSRIRITISTSMIL